MSYQFQSTGWSSPSVLATKLDCNISRGTNSHESPALAPSHPETTVSHPTPNTDQSLPWRLGAISQERMSLKLLSLDLPGFSSKKKIRLKAGERARATGGELTLHAGDLGSILEHIRSDLQKAEPGIAHEY